MSWPGAPPKKKYGFKCPVCLEVYESRTLSHLSRCPVAESGELSRRSILEAAILKRVLRTDWLNESDMDDEAFRHLQKEFAARWPQLDRWIRTTTPGSNLYTGSFMLWRGFQEGFLLARYENELKT